MADRRLPATVASVTCEFVFLSHRRSDWFSHHAARRRTSPAVVSALNHRPARTVLAVSEARPRRQNGREQLQARRRRRSETRPCVRRQR